MALSDELQDAFKDFSEEWECLWIDDFSDDNYRDHFMPVLKKYNNYRLLQHSKNYGQSAALLTGFKNAQGRYYATMDADMQNDPADILKLYKQIKNEQNIAMVSGIRKKRHDSFVRKMSSRIANGFRNYVTHSSIEDVGCSLRVFTRESVIDIPGFRGMHRFLPTLVELKGLNTMQVAVNHRPRLAGVTKYGINNRLWVGLADTFAVRWMQWRLVYPQIKKNI